MTKPKNDIPIALLAERFVLDPTVPSGLRWRFRADMTSTWNTRHAGKPAGSLHINGWLVVLTFGGRLRYLLASRLVYALANARWPAKEVDHIHGVEAGNGIANLRGATPLTPEKLDLANRLTVEGKGRGVIAGMLGVHPATLRRALNDAGS
jgi:hypothetical protein